MKGSECPILAASFAARVGILTSKRSHLLPVELDNRPGPPAAALRHNILDFGSAANSMSLMLGGRSPRRGRCTFAVGCFISFPLHRYCDG